MRLGRWTAGVPSKGQPLPETQADSLRLPSWVRLLVQDRWRQARVQCSSVNMLLVLVLLFLVLTLVWFLLSSAGDHPTQTYWSDCTGDVGSRGGRLLDLSIKPDTIVIPGNISIGMRLDLRKSLTSPSPVHVKLMKRVVFVWIDVPCVDDVGSCIYADLCDRWPFFYECPQSYRDHGIPCECPFTVGNYSLMPPVNLIHVDQSSVIPSWLETGAFWIQASIMDAATDSPFLCLETYLYFQA